MVKKSFFRKPTVSEITKNKNKVEKEVSLENLVESVQSLKENEYLQIIDELIPQNSPNGIRYVAKNEKNYYQKLWQRFLKRGPSIELNNNDITIQKLKENKEPPYKIRERLFNNAKSGKFGISNYGWWDPKTKTHNSKPLKCLPNGHKHQ